MTDDDSKDTGAGPQTEVGPQVHDKQARLRAYVEISAKVRAKFTGPGKAGASYIDLYCGPPKSRERSSGAMVDGSAIVAVMTARKTGHPFTEVHVSDLDRSYAEATAACLQALDSGIRVAAYGGTATDVARQLVGQLTTRGLHLAFLDPFSLGDLPFEVLQIFSRLQRADLLIHVSAMDLQRNLEQAIGTVANHPFDEFMPGWRRRVDVRQPAHDLRRGVLEYWIELVRELGFNVFFDQFELVKGTRNQPLYWLVMAAKHNKASEFWDKIRHTDPQRSLVL